MRILLLSLFVFLSTRSGAQKIPFILPDVKDSIALNTAMTKLAGLTIPYYTGDGTADSLDHIFRLQLLAKKYEDALSSIKAVRSFISGDDTASAKGIAFQFETFANTQLRVAATGGSFNVLYPDVFQKMYSRLSPDAAGIAAGYFAADLKPIRAQVDKFIQQQGGKDSIELKDAVLFCRNYNSLIIYSSIQPLAIPLLTVLENKNYLIQDSLLIKVSDGSSLSAVVVQPRDITGPLPVVLIFNIYAGASDKSLAKMAADRGYIGVVANTRGKFLSQQETEPFEHDASDAYDIINWISKQPWCNGKIGMRGGSYLGFSQWAAVKKMHPALKTIIPHVAVGVGIDFPMHNNVFMSYMLRWIHYVTNNKLTDFPEFGNIENWERLYTKRALTGTRFRSLDSLDERPNTIFQRWLQHPSYDSFWQKMVPYKEEFANINIPILTTTGYFDDDQRGAMYYYGEHLKYNQNANHYLLIGPYDHAGAQSRATATVNGYTIDSVAGISIDDISFQWFDHILKNGPLPPLLQDKVNYEVMGANEWKHVPSLSAMNNDTLTFYLSNIRSGRYYKLAGSKPAVAGAVEQQVSYSLDDVMNDDEDPVIVDSLKRGHRLAFISEKFSKPFAVNGNFTAAINTIINKKDLDINIEIYELNANGKFFLLSNYIGRASYAKDRSKRQLLKPGVPETIPVSNSFFTSKAIAAGSRLVMLVSVNKNTGWQLNYGTGKDVSDETTADGKIPIHIKWLNSSYIKIGIRK